MRARSGFLFALLATMGLAVACGTTNLDALTLSGALTADDVNAVDDVTATDDLVSTDDLSVGDDAVITDDMTVSGDLTVSTALTLSVIPNADLGATCTAGQLRIDTATTKELCYCFATNTWYCWSATTATGPTD